MSNYTDEQKDAISKVIAGLNNGLGMDNDLQLKLEEVDKEFTYHQFYFPGCDMRLRIEGTGTDTEYVRYINSAAKSFDPRFIEDYIDSANSGGFHRYLIYFDPTINDWKSISFDEITGYLQKYYQNGSIKPNFQSNETINDLLKSIFASLIYFDKLDCYKNELKLYQDEFSANSIDPASFDKFINDKGIITSDFIMKKLPSKIGKTFADFKSKDTGYMAPRSLAFNISQDMIDTINNYEIQYKEYKEKLWNLLEGLDSLQLCANRNNSIMQANGDAEISITQMNNCVQNIQNINAELNNENSNNSGSNQEINPSQPSNPASSLYQINKELEKAEEIVENRDKQIKIMIIVLVVIFVLFIGITVFYCIKIVRSKHKTSNVGSKN